MRQTTGRNLGSILLPAFRTGRAVLACAAPIPETILVWENKCLLPGYRRLPGDGCCHPCAGTRLHIGSRLALGLPDHHGDSQHRQDQRAELVGLRYVSPSCGLYSRSAAARRVGYVSKLWVKDWYSSRDVLDIRCGHQGSKSQHGQEFAPQVVAQQIIAEFWRMEKERAQRQGPAA
ncbi:TPA: hypothetical protein ACH3X3_011869 [Trebouxia sp. C0006]